MAFAEGVTTRSGLRTGEDTNGALPSALPCLVHSQHYFNAAEDVFGGLVSLYLDYLPGEHRGYTFAFFGGTRWRNARTGKHAARPDSQAREKNQHAHQDFHKAPFNSAVSQDELWDG